MEPKTAVFVILGVVLAGSLVVNVQMYAQTQSLQDENQKLEQEAERLEDKVGDLQVSDGSEYYINQSRSLDQRMTIHQLRERLNESQENVSELKGENRILRDMAEDGERVNPNVYSYPTFSPPVNPYFTHCWDDSGCIINIQRLRVDDVEIYRNGSELNTTYMESRNSTENDEVLITEENSTVGVIDGDLVVLVNERTGADDLKTVFRVKENPHHGTFYDKEASFEVSGKYGSEHFNTGYGPYQLIRVDESVLNESVDARDGGDDY